MKQHWWVRISARDLSGRLLAPFCHMLVYAVTPRDAAQVEAVIDARDRIRQAVSDRDYELTTSVQSVGTEGMVRSA